MKVKNKHVIILDKASLLTRFFLTSFCLKGGPVRVFGEDTGRVRGLKRNTGRTAPVPGTQKHAVISTREDGEGYGKNEADKHLDH